MWIRKHLSVISISGQTIRMDCSKNCPYKTSCEEALSQIRVCSHHTQNNSSYIHSLSLYRTHISGSSQLKDCVYQVQRQINSPIIKQTERKMLVILMSERVQSLSVTVAAVSLSLSCVYIVAEGETLEEVARLASGLIRSCWQQWVTETPQQHNTILITSIIHTDTHLPVYPQAQIHTLTQHCSLTLSSSNLGLYLACPDQ